MGSEKLYRCSKKKCGWVGTDDEKNQVPNKRFSSLSVKDLVCPKCGCKSFYLIPG